tara:strand:+ start:270 stop:482 length:213 start_codon:yes stop_codon:yes gene_type:complete
MKPKEKAEKLVDKHLASIIFNIKQDIKASVMDASKKSALITIDEIIEELGEDFVNALRYWQEVREEVLKL